MTKNDTAWEKLFRERDILKDIAVTGIHEISAKDINQYREARLMTKFDHRANLPKIFADSELAILPNSRSSYVIGKFDCYAQMPKSKEAALGRAFPSWMQSLTPSNLYSESSALLCAYHAGLIAETLELEQEELKFTVFGRMSTGTFDFSIQAKSVTGDVQHNLTVDRAQCEVDGGFEDTESFAVLEVKNEEVTDFHIRQLYFPYRLWHNKLQKQVIPLFMTYSNEIFTLSAYTFERPDIYNSLTLVRTKRFQIVDNDIEVGDVRQILAETRVQPEPQGVTFPQADSMGRVIDLLAQLQLAEGNVLTQDEITTNYDFDKRQTQYYTNAARYLGLLSREQDAERGVFYTLTEQGARLMMQAPRARNSGLVRLLVQRGVFREAINYFLAHYREPSKEEVVQIMERSQLSISGTTLPRRAQTVLSWVRWVMELTRN